MAAMGLGQILEQTISPDFQTSTHASNQLQNALSSDMAGFLHSITLEIANEGNSDTIRQAASYFLKNQLAMKDRAERDQLHSKWLALPADHRQHIKDNLLRTLATPHQKVGQTVAQAIASIAQAELPTNEWPGLVPALLHNAMPERNNHFLQQASLKTIGYICEEIDRDVVKNHANSLLTAIITGMQQEHGGVRLAATRALLNSLEFVEENFNVENERNFIMQTICQATQSSETQVVEYALQCLVKIMDFYYNLMEAYMMHLFQVTLVCMRAPEVKVALQAVEFWSTVCDQEIDLKIEADEAKQNGTSPKNLSRHYALGALDHLMEVIPQLLTQQEEDNDEYTIAKAAGVCLTLLASVCEDKIVPVIFPFITQNINSEDWHFREAATVAFGTILRGPDPETITTSAKEALPILLRLLEDPHPSVRDTSAWTMGRICEVLPDIILKSEDPNVLSGIVGVFYNCMDREPGVANHICWALKLLAEAAYENAEDEDPDVLSFALSNYYGHLVEKLLSVTERSDAGQSNLRCSAYDTLMTFCSKTPKDCYPHLTKTTLAIVERLKMSVNTNQQVDMQTQNQISQIQSLLCATLRDIIVVLEPSDVEALSDELMALMLHIFQVARNNNQANVQEDALAAIVAIVDQLGERFGRFMEQFVPLIHAGLENHQDYIICGQFAALVGDISRGMMKDFHGFTPAIMDRLLAILNDPNRNAEVVPNVLSAFADICSSIGPDFSYYTTPVMNILKQYSSYDLSVSTFEEVEYLNSLREACLEVYSAMILELRGTVKGVIAKEVYALGDYVPDLMAFIERVAENKFSKDSMLRLSVGIVGDLCDTFQGAMIEFINQKVWLNRLVQKCQKSTKKYTQSAAATAAKSITKLYQQQQ